MNRVPLVILVLLVLLTAACNRAESAQPAPAAQSFGDVERGRQLAAQYGCNVCHVIPGVDGPQGSLGPSLQGLASRPAISFGKVPNTPANLARFIENPAAVNPETSMPPVGVATADARDIAAYLLTLK